MKVGIYELVDFIGHCLSTYLKNLENQPFTFLLADQSSYIDADTRHAVMKVGIYELGWTLVLLQRYAMFVSLALYMWGMSWVLQKH
jgi:hypothetical protein